MDSLLTIKSWDFSRGVMEFEEVEGRVAMKYDVHAYFAKHATKLRVGQMIRGEIAMIKKPFVQQLIDYGANPEVIASLPSVLPAVEGPYHDGLRLETAQLINVMNVY